MKKNKNLKAIITANKKKKADRIRYQKHYAKKFDFCLHRPQMTEWQKLRTKLNHDYVKRAIVSYEHGESGGSQHLQGWCMFDRTRSAVTFFDNERITVKKAIRSNKDHITYVIGMEKEYELKNVLYTKNVNIPAWYTPASVLKLRDLYPWQRKIFNLVQRTPHSRLILYIYEKLGNTGKSSLAKMLSYVRGAIIVGGAAKDIYHGIKAYVDLNKLYPKILIIDASRTDKIKHLFKAIENVKNGNFFNEKFEGQLVKGAHPPHVIVFCNYELEHLDCLSLDRWFIAEINNYNLDIIRCKRSYLDIINFDNLHNDEIKHRELQFGYDFWLADKFITNNFEVFKDRKPATPSKIVKSKQ